MKTPEITQEKLASLQADSPQRLVAVSIAGNDFALKAPPRVEWKRYRSMLFDPAKKAEANQTLVTACLAWPPHDIFALLCEDRPALVDKIANYLCELAGTDDEVVEKKFVSSSPSPVAT